MAKVVQNVQLTCFENEIGNLHWDDVMNEERNTIEENVIAPLLKCKVAMGYKWVSEIKHKADETCKQYKARLLAKGYA